MTTGQVTVRRPQVENTEHTQKTITLTLNPYIQLRYGGLGLLDDFREKHPELSGVMGPTDPVNVFDHMGHCSVCAYVNVTCPFSAGYPAPGRYRERGIVFARFLSLFVCIFVSLYLCIFVSLSARLRENGWTDLHEIFREGVE